MEVHFADVFEEFGVAEDELFLFDFVVDGVEVGVDAGGQQVPEGES